MFVILCFGRLVPVRSIHCHSVLVILCFRCGIAVRSNLLVGRIGKRISADEWNNRRSKEANESEASLRPCKMRFRATESSDAMSI